MFNRTNWISVSCTLFLSLIFYSFIVSCNNAGQQTSEKEEALKKSEDSAATGTASNDTATKASLTSLTVPGFRLNASQLPTVSGGIGNLNPRKFLIQVEFEDVEHPLTTMNLLLFPARNHAHYGRRTTSPITTTREGTTTLSTVTSVVIGHNELKTLDLVGDPPNHHTYVFDYLIFTPKIITAEYDGKQHLVFTISAYRGGKEITIEKNKKKLLPGDTNPCPPYDPGN